MTDAVMFFFFEGCKHLFENNETIFYGIFFSSVIDRGCWISLSWVKGAQPSPIGLKTCHGPHKCSSVNVPFDFYFS